MEQRYEIDLQLSITIWKSRPTACGHTYITVDLFTCSWGNRCSATPKLHPRAIIVSVFVPSSAFGNRLPMHVMSWKPCSIDQPTHHGRMILQGLLLPILACLPLDCFTNYVSQRVSVEWDILCRKTFPTILFKNILYAYSNRQGLNFEWLQRCNWAVHHRTAGKQ